MAADFNAAADVLERGANKPASKAQPVNEPDPTPYVTTGPVGQDSRGFLLTKCLGALQGHIPREQAKEELHACAEFQKALNETGMAPKDRVPGSIMVPLGMDLLPNDTVTHKGATVMKSM